MKLTKEDKEYLMSVLGEDEHSLNQIEEATTTTKFKMNGKRIGIKKVIELLGRKQFLSGLDRCAFHFSCTRETESGEQIHFDNSKMFDMIFGGN